MALSGMNSREKTIIIVLAVVIVIALIGIGLLAAKLLVGDGGSEETSGITVAPPKATITPIEAPRLEPPDQPPPELAGSEPVIVGHQESLGALVPVMIVAQPLRAGRRYRLEITAADGSQVAIEGNWSQAATSAGGQASAPQIEFFEGATPFAVDIVPPVADPDLWSMSVSAGLKEPDLLGQPPKVVITIWDVTGSQ